MKPGCKENNQAAHAALLTTSTDSQGEIPTLLTSVPTPPLLPLIISLQVIVWSFAELLLGQNFLLKSQAR